MHYLDTGELLPEPDFSERVRVMSRHFDLMIEVFGESLGCTMFRKVGPGTPGVSARPPSSTKASSAFPPAPITTRFWTNTARGGPNSSTKTAGSFANILPLRTR